MVTKVKAVQNAPTLQDVLKSFIGLVNYYSKFLPDLSTGLAPLYRLLQKEMKWSWGKGIPGGKNTSHVQLVFIGTLQPEQS